MMEDIKVKKICKECGSIWYCYPIVDYNVNITTSNNRCVLATSTEDCSCMRCFFGSNNRSQFETDSVMKHCFKFLSDKEKIAVLL